MYLCTIRVEYPERCCSLEHPPGDLTVSPDLIFTSLSGRIRLQYLAWKTHLARIAQVGCHLVSLFLTRRVWKMLRSTSRSRASNRAFLRVQFRYVLCWMPKCLSLDNLINISWIEGPNVASSQESFNYSKSSNTFEILLNV